MQKLMPEKRSMESSECGGVEKLVLIHYPRV
jgi:hypothetical protein